MQSSPLPTTKSSWVQLPVGSGPVCTGAFAVASLTLQSRFLFSKGMGGLGAYGCFELLGLGFQTSSSQWSLRCLKP